ncbi:MAG: hypothetical protein HYV24_10865 [Deltaproteobacteria bacterium]|nr:hypothetical protein [Deltaproteobacteria bacterium]
MNPGIRHNESVFLRLLVLLILLAVLPCAIISYIIYGMARDRQLTQSAVLLGSLSADRELATRLLIQRRRDELGFLVGDPETVRLARELSGRAGSSSDKPLEQMVQRSEFFVGLSVMDMATGRSRTAGTFPQEIMERLALEMKQKQEKSFVRAEALPGGARALLFGQSIREEGSGRGEILLGLSRLDIFDDLFEDTSMLGATGESFLTDSRGIALTALRYSSHEKMSHPIDASAMLDCLAGNSKSFVITPDYVGVPTAMSYRPVQSYGGCIMVHMRASEIMAPSKAMRNMVVAIVATTITAIAAMAFLVIRKLTRMDKERNRMQEDLAEHVRRAEAMVAERTRMNKALEERTEELEAANKELEAFSYSAAHDLRAPLRSIESFAQILAKRYSARLDEDGKDFLNIIRDSSKKMRRLIDELLELSKAGRHEINHQEIDMGELARSVIQEITVAPESRTEFNVKTLPPALAERVLIRQVFLNLLSNAVKFTRPVENAVIEVGGESKGNENIYYVRDNGVGFDPKYLNKIFGVFQRLHNSAEFEGTGVGLAIVQRVIQRHGGRVWAEGKVNEGATFYFTIPKEPIIVVQRTGSEQEKI